MNLGDSEISIIFILHILFSLVGVGIWLWMRIDCITKEPAEGNERMIWRIVIAIEGLIGALIYLFARRPQRIAQFGR